MSLCVSLSFLLPLSPDDQGATLCRRDLATEVLQFQQVVGRQLVGLWGRGVGQPAVISRGGGAATAAPTLSCPLQTNAFSALHHGPQLQHQSIGDQFLSAALAGHFGLKGENSRPREHLGRKGRIGGGETIFCIAACDIHRT